MSKGKKRQGAPVTASRLRQESMQRIQNMVMLGAHPAAVDAQMDAEIERLGAYMTPFDVARFAWPKCVPVPISRVSKAILDDYLVDYTMDDLRQGVFIRKTPEDPEPVFVMSWETKQKKKQGGQTNHARGSSFR